MADRTLGWVQDPGRIEKLRNVVELFDPTTAPHKELVRRRIPNLVKDLVVQARLLAALNAPPPLALTYSDLKGKHTRGKNSNAPCNGIVQAALPGQNKPFLTDWASDNFVRWAHSLGFLSYHTATDTFSLTPLGQEYINLPTPISGVNAALEEAMLASPPVVRVLRLLSQQGHLTKFEMGKQFGFVGEAGFTTMNQSQIIHAIASASPTDKTKISSNREGSADRYTRSIAAWLIHLGWVQQAGKAVTVQVAGQTYTETIGQAYLITHAGQLALERSEGQSRHAATSKYVPFEMLASKEGERQYLRSRRATLLLALQSGGKALPQLQRHMRTAGFDRSDEPTIKDDIDGLVNIGLRVPVNATGTYHLRDTIHGLVIPAFSIPQTQGGDVENLKQSVRAKLSHVPHDALVLIDLSFEGRKNYRVFESQVAALLQTCGYEGVQLGDANRPDGAFFTTGLSANYGLIVDAKSYSKGFNCGADDRDEMGRYVRENQVRPANHVNKWWAVFPNTLSPNDDFRFLFVTSRLVQNYAAQFIRLSTLHNNIPGGGISAANLLLFAEEVLAKRLSLSDGRDKFAVLNEVTV